jgi:hypothetical protein
MIVNAETGTDKALRIAAAPTVAIDSFLKKVMAFPCFTKLNVGDKSLWMCNFREGIWGRVYYVITPKLQFYLLKIIYLML